MLCQNCNHSEAEMTIRFSYREQPQWEVRLCPHCAAQIQQLTQAAMVEMHRRAGLAGETKAEQIPLNPRAGQEMIPSYVQSALSEEEAARLRARRQRNELEALLREAVEEENYEEAARLRDALKDYNKGVTCHD